MSTDRITLSYPDDWHLHLRDGAALADTVPHSARTFRRAIVMPNLAMPITTGDLARSYRDEILRHVPAGSHFEALMTLYLTDSLSPEEIRKAWDSNIITAVKYYPAGATTNSENGVTDIEKVYPAIEALSDLGVPLLIHGEVTNADIDIFDREEVFIETVLQPLTLRFPNLKIVLEHITTKSAAVFVEEGSPNLAATITAHHLLYNRNHLLAGGVRPHLYCLPILKRDNHQQALIEAATSGNNKFFLGTDSAPHPVSAKESTCGCAGIFTAHAALEFYAEAFDKADALDKLEAFASFNGADFYGLPRNQEKITLCRSSWQVPTSYSLGTTSVIPLRSGETVAWRVQEDT